MAELPEYYIIRKTHEGKAEITYECSKVKTNADRIRAMSEEELATFIVMNGYGSCPIVPICPQYDKGKPYAQDGCIKCWRDWLKAEVEDG